VHWLQWNNPSSADANARHSPERGIVSIMPTSA
jgi:hypothetical protein